MQTFERVSRLRACLDGERRAGRRIAFVPTMGNLHEGHYSLIDLAREQADVVVASTFVNPTQFGPGEDFERYPRTPGEDARGLAERGCHALFRPAIEELYPHGTERAVRVHVPDIGDVLEGANRPGHFDGVASIVTRLLHCVQPDVAVFGLKDFQQWLVVRRLVADLVFPVRLVGGATRRDADGLALSSRNRYLDAAARQCALAIPATLHWMAESIKAGSLPDAIEETAMERLRAAGLAPDYAVIRRAADLGVPAAGEHDGLIALIAARAGAVRLIDNLMLG
jgi:pantoate--beta-alanine ligase